MKELEELGILIKSISPVNDALSGNKDSLVRQYILVRRRFGYAAFAVTLYASFEKFIEGLIAAYARLESRRLQYTELPEKLTKKHLLRTAEILYRRRIGEGRYANLTERDVVKNLFECLNGATSYTLNEAAVIAHDLNLRATLIDELFATVGLENMCDRVRRADDLVTWYLYVNGVPAAPQGGVPATAIEERIKDIIERRNRIAHIGGPPDNLPDMDEMSETVEFIRAFAKSVFTVTVSKYLRNHHSGIQFVLRQNDGPYKNGKVVIINPPTHRIFCGQPIFVLEDTIGARWGRIQSLQVNGTEVRELEANADAPTGVGVGLDFKYPKNTDAKLVALPNDDDVVWSQLEPMAVPTSSTF